jgi:hypothetical protein
LFKKKKTGRGGGILGALKKREKNIINKKKQEKH